jgi:hypothetical protein
LVLGSFRKYAFGGWGTGVGGTLGGGGWGQGTEGEVLAGAGWGGKAGAHRNGSSGGGARGKSAEHHLVSLSRERSITWRCVAQTLGARMPSEKTGKRVKSGDEWHEEVGLGNAGTGFGGGGLGGGKGRVERGGGGGPEMYKKIINTPETD